MSGVVAKRVESVEWDSPPGAFEYFTASDGEAFAGIIYCCPCGCGRTGVLDFKPASSPSWQWDGNVEQPTLHPSVNHVGHWHGWLRDGVWTLA